MIKMSEYARRRKQLMQKIGPRGLVILASAPVARRNGDADYPYRQQSDFYYLTGFEEPEAVMILAPKRKAGEFIIFNRVRDPVYEIWDGARAGQDGARKKFGAQQAFPYAELEKRLPEIMEGRQKIHYAIGVNKNFDKNILSAMNKIRGKIRAGLQAPVGFTDITDTLHEMRLIKSRAEIAVMRKAAEISAAAHVRAMKFCKPGVNEYELEAEIAHEFQRQGARFPAYTSIIGSGANSCVLHYIANDQVIKKNDIVLIDAGSEYQNYASDITRTFPANGKFSHRPYKKRSLLSLLHAQIRPLVRIRCA
jgi:Xaa-Pro aminopeptidase